MNHASRLPTSATPPPPRARRLAPGPVGALVASLLVGAACGPLLGIEDVGELGGPAGAAGLSGAPAGPSQGAAGAGAGAGGAGGTAGGVSGGGGRDGGGGGANRQGFLRFANFEGGGVNDFPSLGRDVCVRAGEDGPWRGPLMRGEFGLSPLDNLALTPHVAVPQGVYQVRAISAADASCDDAVAPVDTAGVVVDNGSFVTVAIVSSDGVTSGLVSYLDGRPTVANGAVDLALAHAVSGPEGADGVAFEPGGQLKPFAFRPQTIAPGEYTFDTVTLREIQYEPEGSAIAPERFGETLFVATAALAPFEPALVACTNGPGRSVVAVPEVSAGCRVIALAINNSGPGASAGPPAR